MKKYVAIIAASVLIFSTGCSNRSPKPKPSDTPSISPSVSVTSISPSPSVSPSNSPSPSVSSSPSSSPSASPTPSKSVTVNPILYPTATSTGVPVGWNPRTTYTSDLVINQANTVVENVRVSSANISVRAVNVTLKNVEVVDGFIDNTVGANCYNGMVLENVTVRKDKLVSTPNTVPAISTGGYTAKNVKIFAWPEGFRVGGNSYAGCGPVYIENSYVEVRYPDQCPDDAWHGDGLQGYDGNAVKLYNNTFKLVTSPTCGGTDPFFYPGGSAGNTRADIDRMIVQGGGFGFRLGTAGSVKNLNVVNGSTAYNPVDIIDCDLIDGPVTFTKVNLDDEGQPVPVASNSVVTRC